MFEKGIRKRQEEPELLEQFRKRFFGEVYDLKSFELILGIYMFQMEEGRKYVTRDTLYERLEIEPSKMRAYDTRLKSLLEAGWLELDDEIKGRYRLTPIARFYIAEHAESANMVLATVTYEETLQFMIKAKVNPPELMNNPEVRNGCKLKLIKRGYEIVRSDEDILVLVNQRLRDYALVETVLQSNEVEIRITSNFVHATKRLKELLQLEEIGKLNMDEERTLQALSVMVLNQVWQTIKEVAFIEAGYWKFFKSLDLAVKEVKKEDQPKYYILQNM